MYSWPEPEVPKLAGAAVPLQLFDTADGEVRPVVVDGTAGMFVCGITPYDATHLGHAATYIAFDLIYRQLLDNGYDVHYVQNVTDVDEPLFARAERDGVDWRELGTEQIDLFRSDMEQLRILPPRDYVSVMHAVDEVIELVNRLIARGAVYELEGDLYASIDATSNFGYESNYDQPTMLAFFAERGGDPDRPGKRHPLDALVWRKSKDGEPEWDAPFGPGRPGWHIECSAIATNRLGPSFAIQGGGKDLIFPHHEFSAAHAEAALGCSRMAGHYVHAGMLTLGGRKMSKSLGNLLFVSKLVAAGHDPRAIRLGIISGHYRASREWTEELLAAAEERLERWERAVEKPSDEEAAQELVQLVRACLANDLDTPSAIAAIDAWADDISGAGSGGEIVGAALDALFGLNMRGEE
ncbi:cysteine--1-D-myo-inosityl 2-amino-2-deoxy-alpha-D-glucopyranoside ligase [Corynebacterium canis]|uniref:L-cysteine:1D-myo-inositol 2-amino-2-deoxy-alpha-D-glucopyranoside ligase n=1 Tax=Corynebacterium canis TaxID=679663 RepID=A0A5C5US70_9CORY|nr:cysteine--1-D-myo-inosityl 2-amino-2-deoxy-alpha-D-glucopyranoside ligase [Corynebacterium canis]TWT29056.1 cysteine--1-D-myo-inosityl 2-amino-2-deoxy-alpha-D-glucopyranoside ligase [Corynebacterium canis]WJY75282.1 L-cysteine:1D-myo-inositol 2-amino-2-deoxy-alpha-D-glucopyranoside ligase [Corynebacterium canis]